METFLGILCLLAIFGVFVWAVDLVLFAPVRAFRRWERRQERTAAAVEQAVAHRDAELAELRGKVEDLDAVAEALGRTRQPESQQPPAGRPRLRVIRGGPDAQPPDEDDQQRQPTAECEPKLPPGPPFPPGEYRLELPDPDGPTLTVWQRNYVRSMLMRNRADLHGRKVAELTTAEAEAIVAAMGGKPRKLYTGGRAWGQRRRS